MKKYKKKIIYGFLIILSAYVFLTPTGAIRWLIFWTGHPIIACTTKIQHIPKIAENGYEVSDEIYESATDSNIHMFEVQDRWIFKKANVVTAF